MWTEWQAAIAQVVDECTGSMTDGQYYIQFVPKEATYPYISTKSNMSSTPKHVMGGGKATEDFTYPFIVWCDLTNGGPVEVSNISEELTKGLEVISFNPIEMPNYILTGFLRTWETPVLQDSEDDTLFYQAFRYRVLIKAK